jgi:hypothetical protein
MTKCVCEWMCVCFAAGLKLQARRASLIDPNLQFWKAGGERRRPRKRRMAVIVATAASTVNRRY